MMELGDAAPLETGLETSLDTERTPDDTRARIIAAAIDLLTTGGRDALTTRAVAAAAGVQAPAIYRIFGDKGGLLDAVIEDGFVKYLAEKEVREFGPDPLEDLRFGWDMHIGFGLSNPALYSLMYGEPRPGVKSRAATLAWQILQQHIRRIAAAGRLKVSEERAANMVHAAGSGTIFALLAMPESARDLNLSRANREAVIAAITLAGAPVERPTPATAAIALKAVLPEASCLSSGERQLLEEWLDRLAEES